MEEGRDTDIFWVSTAGILVYWERFKHVKSQYAVLSNRKTFFFKLHYVTVSPKDSWAIDSLSSSLGVLLQYTKENVCFGNQELSM